MKWVLISLVGALAWSGVLTGKALEIATEKTDWTDGAFLVVAVLMVLAESVGVVFWASRISHSSRTTEDP